MLLLSHSNLLGDKTWIGCDCHQLRLYCTRIHLTSRLSLIFEISSSSAYKTGVIMMIIFGNVKLDPIWTNVAFNVDVGRNDECWQVTDQFASLVLVAFSYKIDLGF